MQQETFVEEETTTTRTTRRSSKKNSAVDVKDKVKADKVKTDKVKTDKVKADKVKADKVKTDKVKTDQIKADKVKADKARKESEPKTEEKPQPEPKPEPKHNWGSLLEVIVGGIIGVIIGVIIVLLLVLAIRSLKTQLAAPVIQLPAPVVMVVQQPAPATQPAATQPAPIVVQPTAMPPVAPATTGNADVLLANPPFKTTLVKNEKGVTVTALSGFDLAEFGGNDSKCLRTDTETIHLGEVVSSENESCLIVVEWSLKQGASTVVTGVYAVKPGEWFYVPLAVEGINDNVRIIGTIWYLPRGWNSHMFAADLASDRDLRDGTVSIVGLSPTDPWVVSIAEALAK